MFLSESACDWYFGIELEQHAVLARWRRRWSTPTSSRSRSTACSRSAWRSGRRAAALSRSMDEVDARAAHAPCRSRRPALRAPGSAIACSTLGRPRVELVDVQALHHHAVVLVAHAAADLERRRQAHERPEAGEAAVSARSCCWICCAVLSRVARGVSCTCMRLLFAEPPLDAREERLDVRVLDDDVGDLLRPRAPCRCTTFPGPRAGRPTGCRCPDRE